MATKTDAEAFIEYQSDVHGIAREFWASNVADMDVLAMWAEGASDAELRALQSSVSAVTIEQGI